MKTYMLLSFTTIYTWELFQNKISERSGMTERQFKIKVGTLRRVKKDLEYYAKELDAQKKKIDKMRTDSKDEYDIRKQEEVLLETETMLPDCQSRLKEAAKDVDSFIKAHHEEVEPLESFQEAQLLLEVLPGILD